jgi:YggT family protein
MSILFRLIRALFGLYYLVLIARALLPMLGVSYAHPVMRFIYQITEPLLGPIRRRLPPTSGLDFSPLVLMIILWFLEQFLLQLARALIS